MLVYVTVGPTVVASFSTQMNALKFCVKNIAPGCNAILHKCYTKKTRRTQSVPGQMRNRGEARQHQNRIKYLAPGEFKL